MTMPAPQTPQNTDDAPMVMLVDDTPANLDVLIDYLSEDGYEVLVATNGKQALERCRFILPDLILLDVMMPGIDGFETCRRLQEAERTRDVPVLFMTALSDTRDKVEGFEAGGVDYITKPIQVEEVRARVDTHLELRRLRQKLEAHGDELEERVEERTRELKEALEKIRTLSERLERENTWLRSELEESRGSDDIIGDTPAIESLGRQIELVAPTNASVLILGESGTGKELVAREVHRQSQRADHPIVKVNCAAIPRELYESTFFGHARGAFTGARSKREGRFQAADGGTLFLDEVGEIPLELQSKLLRVLQEGSYERVGEDSTREVDVRIIAATNRDLKQAVAERTFREDLYYRLNVFPIQVPSLRERREDVPLLARHFIERCSARLGIQPPKLTDTNIHRLQNHDWPGNVRELENVVERAVILARATGELRFDLGDGTAIPHATPTTSQPILDEEAVKAFIRDNTRRALEASDWRIRGDGGAAEILGLKPTTLASRIKRMELEKPE